MNRDRVYFTMDPEWVFFPTEHGTTVLKQGRTDFDTSSDTDSWAYSYSISTGELRELLRLMIELGLVKKEYR